MTGALIGGVAVSVLARPRATRDIDVVVWLPSWSEWPAFVARMHEHGLAFREGGSLDFALRSRVLLLVHGETGVPVDVSMGALPVEEELVRHAVVREESGLALALPRPDDVVILKAIAGRPRDRIDIESLLECNPGIDRARVRLRVSELADALEAPELVADLDELFARVP